MKIDSGEAFGRALAAWFRSDVAPGIPYRHCYDCQAGVVHASGPCVDTRLAIGGDASALARLKDPKSYGKV